MEKLTNVENEWGDCVKHAQSEGPISSIKLEEVEVAMKHMKNGKASWPTGVVIERLKAGGECCLKLLTKIFNKVLLENK